ncbi:hypothetical protein PLESTB_001420800 [Pleodorina starrii]|uniref:Cyclin-like domain-containing protein n=1 Tax=Pleodorina starrii TaxID=330485 RepID=A0A9W6F7W0_9CHLO|nr:hypothetical protein PLESTB_001420800 [Pleodorina starrii]
MCASDKQISLRAAYGAQQPPQGVRPWSRECAAPADAHLTTSQTCSGQPGAWACAGDIGPAADPKERVYRGWPESSLGDRRLLVGWMMELTRAAQLQRETLFLATSLLDRFLAASSGSTFEPPERMLQLVAMACISVAMKFEEVVPLDVSDLVRLAVDPETGAALYQASHLGQMEWRLLWVVDWCARAPTSLSFLQHFLLCCGPTADTTASASASDAASTAGSSARRTAAPAATGSTAAAADAVAMGSLSSFRGSSRRFGDTEGNGVGGDVDGNSLEIWAHRILDLALLHHCDLVHCQSTVALACLALGERAAAAFAPLPPPPPPAVGPAPYGACAAFAAAAVHRTSPCLAALQNATGLSMDELAPNLSPCLALVEHLCSMEQQGLLQPPQKWPQPPPQQQHHQPQYQQQPIWAQQQQQPPAPPPPQYQQQPQPFWAQPPQPQYQYESCHQYQQQWQQQQLQQLQQLQQQQHLQLWR